MKTISFATGVGLILQIAAASAQQGAPNEPAHKVHVISGCLRHSSAATSIFTLTDATVIGQPLPADPSNADADVGAGPRSYDVVPVSSVSEQGINRETLESHVGSRVEVTVRPIEAAQAPSTTTSTSKATAAKIDESLPRRYTAVTINKVLGSCEIEQPKPVSR
jgi:hypothetical protein